MPPKFKQPVFPTALLGSVSPPSTTPTSASAEQREVLVTALNSYYLQGLYNSTRRLLLDYCLSCASAAKGPGGADRVAASRRRVQLRTEQSLHKALGCHPQHVVARTISMSSTKAVSDAAARLIGRGWPSETVMETVNNLVSPVLKTLGLVCTEETGRPLQFQLELWPPVVPSQPPTILRLGRGGFLGEWSGRLNLPELRRLLRPLWELITLRWTLENAGIMRQDLLDAFTGLASSSAQLAASQFPLALMDALAMQAACSFILMALNPDDPELYTNTHLHQRLWPLFCRLQTETVKQALGSETAAELGERLAQARVEELVAAVRARQNALRGQQQPRDDIGNSDSGDERRAGTGRRREHSGAESQTAYRVQDSRYNDDASQREGEGAQHAESLLGPPAKRMRRFGSGPGNARF